MLWVFRLRNFHQPRPKGRVVVALYFDKTSLYSIGIFRGNKEGAPGKVYRFTFLYCEAHRRASLWFQRLGFLVESSDEEFAVLLNRSP